ncbi:MAG: hypothetical protein Q8P11_02175 [bacterium]|nr:hypothetical protein [bacterium]
MRSTIFRVVGSLVLVTIVSEGLWALFRIAGITLFADSRYWCTWGSIAQGLTTGVPSSEFLYWSLGINIITALIFILLYRKVRKVIGGGIFLKGLKFSLFVFLAGALPILAMGALMVYLSPALLILGIGMTLLVTLINGIIVAAINRQ